MGPGWSLQGVVHAVREGHALEEKKSKNEVYKWYGYTLLSNVAIVNNSNIDNNNIYIYIYTDALTKTNITVTTSKTVATVDTLPSLTYFIAFRALKNFATSLWTYDNLLTLN